MTAAPVPAGSPSAWWATARGELGAFPTVFFAIVVVAAGASGVALLVAPASTDRYFSWTLRPPEAAALIGGFYLASAVIFAWALHLPRRQVQPLVVGVLGLAVPTLVLTLVFDEVFDFARWQAVAWVLLFVGAPVSATTILWLLRSARARPPRLPARWRVVLGGLSTVFATLAVLVWLDATRPALARHGPVDLVRLTGTYLGAWCSFLAVLCARATVGGRWDDARVALATVAAAAAGVTLALLRTITDIRRPVPSLMVSLGLFAVAAWAYGVNRPASQAPVGRRPV